MRLLKLENVSKCYGEGDGSVHALKNISFNIKKGEMVAIMGTSGSGKSTLLNILGCLDSPSSGEYYIKNQLVKNLNDRDIAKLRNETFGFVVQYFALLEDYNIKSNIAIPLEYSKNKISKKEKNNKIENLAKLLNIENKLKKYPKELSGGQCQRAAIARALINNPDIILADEPTGSLDKTTGEDVIRILRELNTLGTTILIVTHNEDIGKKCDKIIRIEDGIIIEGA